MAETALPRYISCDLANYDDGGFLDGEDLLARIVEEHRLAAPATRRETLLYPATAYERVFERGKIHASEPLLSELEAFYDQTTRLYPRAASVSLVRIENARILDRALYQMEGEAVRPFYELHRHGDRHYLEWVDRGGPAQELPDDRDYILLTSSGTFNWGHWLVDDLARVRGVMELAARSRRKVCVLMHGYYAEIDRARVYSLRAVIPKSLGIAYQMIAPHRTYLARSLHFATPVSVHPGLKHPDALADLATLGRIAAEKADRGWFRRRPARPGRLFVLRRPDLGRVPSNLEEVAARVTARGFAPFDPESATPLEQISAFSAAREIVGCMGAAMAGSLFSPPGTKLLYLAPDTFRDPFYWDQAAARGHSYQVVYGPTIDASRPTESDYVIDLARLDAALDELDRA